MKSPQPLIPLEKFEESWQLCSSFSSWAWRVVVELKDDVAAVFGPDIFQQIVITIHAFILCFPTPLPPACDEATMLWHTLVSADFKAFLDSCSLLETLVLNDEDVWLSLMCSMTFSNEHSGMHCLAKILEFIDCSDYCPLWKEQLNDSTQHKHSFEFCKAALINMSTHSHPGARSPPTPQPRLHLCSLSHEWAVQMP